MMYGATFSAGRARGPGEGLRIARQPLIARNVVAGHEPVAATRPAKKAGHRYLALDQAALPRARVLPVLGDETAVHVDIPAVGGLKRRHDEIADPAMGTLGLGEGEDDVGFAVVEIAAGDADRLVLERGEVEIGPAIRWRRCNR